MSVRVSRILEQGLATTRERRSFLFQEPLFLTALARAHLGRGDAEAARLFTAMGATGQAERVARELDR